MRYCPPSQTLDMHAALERAGIVARVYSVLMSGVYTKGVSGLLCWVVQERSGGAVFYKIVAHYRRRWAPQFPGRDGWAEAVFAASTDRPFGLREHPCLTSSEMQVVESVATGKL